MKKRRKPVSKRKTKAAKSRISFKIHFKNASLLQAALCHPSYRYENPKLKLENFDRLEFFGDSILNFVICRKIYALYPEADEGALSKLRSILVSRKILSRIAKDTGLLKALQVGRGLREQKELLKTKICSDAFEALIAAYYFDKGFEKTEKFILSNFRPYFDAKKLFRLDPNPKSSLQELVQKHWKRLPEYTSLAVEKGFQTQVSVTASLKSSALGKNRQDSEEKAARLLLRVLRQDLLGRSKRKSSARKL